MSKQETIISIDIETDGPAAGLNSMLSLGAVAYDEQDNELGTWYSALYPLLEARQNPDTMAWWQTQPEAWAEVNRNRRHPQSAIVDFDLWVRELPGKKIAVAWPDAFDFSFVNYYCWRFAGRNLLGFAACDIRSYANGLAGYPSYYGLPEAKVREMAGPIDTSGLRAHVALDDAIEQGHLFLALRRYARKHQTLFGTVSRMELT